MKLPSRKSHAFIANIAPLLSVTKLNYLSSQYLIIAENECFRVVISNGNKTESIFMYKRKQFHQ